MNFLEQSLMNSNLKLGKLYKLITSSAVKTASSQVSDNSHTKSMLSARSYKHDRINRFNLFRCYRQKSMKLMKRSRNWIWLLLKISRWRLKNKTSTSCSAWKRKRDKTQKSLGRWSKILALGLSSKRCCSRCQMCCTNLNWWFSHLTSWWMKTL